MPQNNSGSLTEQLTSWPLTCLVKKNPQPDFGFDLLSSLTIKGLESLHKLKELWNPENILSPSALHSFMSATVRKAFRCQALFSLWKPKCKLFPHLRTSSTRKPFDLASWVRKLLLLRPIFLSTRYSLTSSNFTSSCPAAAASAGLRLFLTRGTIGVWNMSFEESYPNYLWNVSVAVCHFTSIQEKQAPW